MREICKHSKKYANKRAATTTASTATNTASAAAVAGCSNTIASPKPESGVQTRSKTGSTPSSSSSATKKEENIQQCVKCNDASSDNLGSSKNGDTNAPAADNDDDSSSDREPKSDAYMKVDIQPHPNMYDSPSNLIRAMMYLGTIEEDAPDLIECEWNVNEVEESKNVAQEYPLLLDKERHVSNGVIRANRPWKTEQNRVDVIRLLATAHRAGMASQSDEGGETPLILCCRTLKGGNDDDELDDDMEEDDMEDGLGDRPNNGQDDAVDETGEDVADYEMDLPSFEPVGVESESPPVDEVFGDIMPQPEQNNVEGVVEGQGNNEGAPAEPAEQNVNEGVAANNNEGANNPNQPPVDPLQAIFIMIAIDKTNRHDALGTPDDEGDTPLHTATRIGAPSRLVRHILNALPSSASTPAEDGATPLHLVCRRASHLAPEGPAGLATYDSDTIRLFADAAGAGTLVAADDEGRTPLHVACYHGASPAALAELADADGGNESLLVRDMEGHAPVSYARGFFRVGYMTIIEAHDFLRIIFCFQLGVYCKHATDFHGLRVLVEACPEAAAAVGDGKQLPLHRVVGAFNLTVNVDVLKLLGTAYPRGLSAKDSNGMSPLALLCNSYRSPLSIDLPKLKDGRTTLGRCLSNKIWLMVKYLVLAGRVNTEWNRSHMITEAGNLDEDGNVVSVPPPERMLHAALREPASSIEIIMLTLVIHQDQLPLADEDGNTPLHICCYRDSGCTEKGEDASDDLPADDDSVYERVNKECVIDNLPNGCEVDISNRGETSPRRRYNPYADFNPILFYILSHDRSAAERRNKDGKYPLNILIDKGSTWIGGGVERVFKACPAALFSYEMNNSIFVRTLTRAASFRTSNPFKLKEEQAKSIGALFQLLRGKPTVLEGAFKGKVVARRNPRRSASTQSSTAGVETKKKRARTTKK